MDASSPTPPVLVVLAAGLGTRFGGPKPLAPVGPAGEPLLLVSLGQAVAAGFTDAVVVVGGPTEALIAGAVGGAPLPVRLARQDAVGPPRAKPWGTVAAALAAEVRGDAVLVNGDDLYGTAGLARARRWFDEAPAADAALVGYRVDVTLASSGGVSRAVVEADAAGRLTALAEHRDVRRRDDGTITSDLAPELPPGTLVSMNLWCVRAPVWARLAERLERFVAAAGDDPAAELGLPDAVGALVAEGALAVDVLPTDSPWHGVTWPDDVATVRAALTAERDASA